MAENNTLLEKLDGLVARFEEVSTLITDPNVISDQKRYVKLTKEYKELGDRAGRPDGCPQGIPSMSQRIGRSQNDDERERSGDERNGS